MSIFSRIYSGIQNESFIAKNSLKLSRKEIDNIKYKDRIHYFSEQKARVFLEFVNGDVVEHEKKTIIGGITGNILKSEVKASEEREFKNNLYKEVKEAIKTAKKGKVIVPYEMSRRGKYILVHFPFYNGKMELKTQKKYENLYWWCGEYRNLRIFACGNEANRVDDRRNVGELLWNPSGTRAAKEFFDDIETSVLTGCEYDVKDVDIFSNYLCILNNGTMRGTKSEGYHCWCEMLLRCDAVENENGCINIWGSPIFVSYNTDLGYGWYLRCEDNYKKYYQEWNKRWVEHYFVLEDLKGKEIEKTYNVKNGMKSGFDFGYRIEGTTKKKLRFIRNVKKILSKDINKMNKIIQQFIDTSKIEDVKSVYLPMKMIKKRIRSK